MRYRRSAPPPATVRREPLSDVARCRVAVRRLAMVEAMLSSPAELDEHDVAFIRCHLNAVRHYLVALSQPPGTQAPF